MKRNKLMANPFIRKFVYAMAGLKIAIKEEKSLVIHIVIAVLAIILSGVLKLDVTKWAIVILVIGFVISLELVNTTIENVIDLVCFKYNVNAKKIKDVSAAATLVISLSALIIGLLIFIERIVYLAKNGY